MELFKLPAGVNATVRFLDEARDSIPASFIRPFSHEAQPVMCCNADKKHFVRAAKLRTPEPKQHKRKRWMSDAYHNRIQKKWNKKALTLPKVVDEIVTVSLSASLMAKIEAIAKGAKRHA